MARPRSDSLAVAVLLTALVSFGPLSTDLYLPALPTLQRVFATDAASVQFTLSVFLMGFAVAQLAMGPLSDRFGRRPVLMAGLVVYIAASVACALAADIGQLTAARLVQAVGACCGPVLGRAVVRDVYGRERAARMYAYMSMAMALAPAVAPMIGGALTQGPGWRAGFALLATLGAAALAAVWLMLEETNRHRDADATDPGRLLSNYVMLLREPTFRGYALCFAAMFAALFAFISGSSFVLIGELGLSPVRYGMAFAAVIAGYMAGSFAAGRLTVRLGIDRMITIGLAAGCLGGFTGAGLALAGVVSLPAIILPVTLVMAAAGLVLPNAMAGAIAPFGTMAGTASALLGFLQMLVAALVGMAVGHFADRGPLPMMAGIAVTALLAAVAHPGRRRLW